MNIPNIYSNKYSSVALPELCAPRGELIARLDKAAGRGLVFVSAPEGSGKTVSALLWMKNSRRKTIWIGLDAYDNSVPVFYRMFCTGLLSAQPENERMNAILSDPSFDSSPVEHTINLLMSFVTDGGEYALALDDFHTITNNDILKSLPFILRRMPNSFVVLILSRLEPNEHFKTFIEQEQTAAVTAENLAFGKNEIAEYFTLIGRKISDNDAEAISNYTGGWAIGVNVLAQSTAHITAENGVPFERKGVQVLGNYIEEHLWSKWDAGLRKFMLDSAALDEMPVPLCIEITERADAGTILEQMRAGNAFVSRVEHGVYRYHHLFLDFLRARPEYMKAGKKKLFIAAAKYYISIGDDLAAQRYAYESGNTRIILKIITTTIHNKNYHLDDFLDIARDFYLAPSIESLCAKLPLLYAIRAYVATLVGDAELCMDSSDKLRRNLPLIILKYPQLAELAFACSALDFRVPFVELAERINKLPLFLFSSKLIKIGFMTLQMPFLHRINRDYYELADAGNWPKVKDNFGKLYKDHFEAMYLCKSGGLLLEQNQSQAALSMALDAYDQITPQMEKEMRFSVQLHLSAAYSALNKQGELANSIQEAEQFINSEARFLRPNFLAFTARLKIWDGDAKEAKKWLEHYFVNETKVLELYRIYQYFTTIRAYIVLGDFEKAKSLGQRLRKLGKDFNRPLDAAEAGVLLAVILWAEGKKDEAAEALEAVLAELEPHKFVRVIADEGMAVVPIMKKLAAKCERANYKGELNPLYVKNTYLAANSVSKQRRGITANLEMKPIKLSKKQKLVIELLAQGHNREGMMEKTGLTLNTIKTHTRLAYEKLGVDNAADAVLVSKELGII